MSPGMSGIVGILCLGFRGTRKGVRPGSFAGSHLMDAACNELVEAHEGGRCEAGRKRVVFRGREVFCPTIQELLPGPLSKGHICLGHKGRGGYVRAEWGGHLESQWKAGEAFSVGDR